jgi:hypothetical protein
MASAGHATPEVASVQMYRATVSDSPRRVAAARTAVDVASPHDFARRASDAGGPLRIVPLHRIRLDQWW